MDSTKSTLEKLSGGLSIALWGEGVSTKSVEKLCSKFGISCVYYSDINGANKFDECAAKNHKLAIYSPSWKNSDPYFEIAKNANIQTMGEPELAGLLWKGKVIAISGTNGKTTLTAFLAQALNKAGFEAYALGNIGEPMCEYADKSEGKIAVCELSSFQGMRLKHLGPDAYVWTNFAPDHLDWHSNLKEYFLAKLEISKTLKSEIFIVGSGIEEAAKEFNVTLPGFTSIVKKSENISAPAPFNNSIQAENFELAKALFAKLGLDENILYETAKAFKLASHRFALTAEIEGIKFWNDSKATNAHSAIAALKELKGKNLFWIGGGKNKYCDLDSLIKTVSECAVGAALIGQTAEILKDKLPQLPLGVKICKTLDEAVNFAFKSSKKGGNVLFSPAFSSFGMFENYEDRGKSFEKIVLCLK